jgi:transposase
MILQLVATGKSVTDISREYGISEQTIYNWKKNNTPVAGSSLTHLRQENEIFKKKWLYSRGKLTQ